MREGVYRITGHAAVLRLSPLLPKIHPHMYWRSAQMIPENVDFVWETTCETTWRKRHTAATVYNKLHGSSILEDKASLAYLQLRMNVPVLETKLAQGKGVVMEWALSRWDLRPDFHDWWVVKAALGNGGSDVWVLHAKNVEEVTNELYVIQRYVERPLLWNGKKFHFRCYAFFTSQLETYLYRMCFILTASQSFSKEVDDELTHITNLAVNKYSAGYPGQIPCDLSQEFPSVFIRIQQLLHALADAVVPFMSEQTGLHHFEFLGLDIVADESDTAWLIEVNRLPGLASSKLNKAAEDHIYNKMMQSMLGYFSARAFGGQANLSQSCWVKVTNPSTKVNVSSQNTWMNTMKWKAFTHTHKRKLHVQAAD